MYLVGLLGYAALWGMKGGKGRRYLSGPIPPASPYAVLWQRWTEEARAAVGECVTEICGVGVEGFRAQNRRHGRDSLGRGASGLTQLSRAQIGSPGGRRYYAAIVEELGEGGFTRMLEETEQGAMAEHLHICHLARMLNVQFSVLAPNVSYRINDEVAPGENTVWMTNNGVHFTLLMPQ